MLIAAPRTYKTIRRGVWWESMRGVGEHSEYELLQEEKSLNKEKQMPLRGWEKQYRDWLAMLATWTLYQPRWLKLDIGQSMSFSQAICPYTNNLSYNPCWLPLCPPLFDSGPRVLKHQWKSPRVPNPCAVDSTFSTCN